jgi:type II secretory pathway pseudopilin PulG
VPSNRLGGNSGFTLIEALITVAITAVIVIAMASLFDYQNRTSRLQQSGVEVEQNLRVAMEMIQRDLRNSGANLSYLRPIVPTPLESEPIDGDFGVNGNVPLVFPGSAVPYVAPSVVSQPDVLTVVTLDPNVRATLNTPARLTGGAELFSNALEMWTCNKAQEPATPDTGCDTSGGPDQTYELFDPLDDASTFGQDFNGNGQANQEIVALTECQESTNVVNCPASPDRHLRGRYALLQIEGISGIQPRTITPVSVGSSLINSQANLATQTGAYPWVPILQGFQKGTKVFRANYRIYAITDPDGDRPFLAVDQDGPDQLNFIPVVEGIEDIQLAFCLDVGQNGCDPNDPNAWSQANQVGDPADIRYIRITLVGKSPFRDQNLIRAVSNLGRRPAAEDHVAGAIDGSRRRLLTTVVNVVNYSMWDVPEGG